MKDVKRVISKVKQSDIDQLQTKVKLGYKISIIIESEEEPTKEELIQRITELEVEVALLKTQPLYVSPQPIYNPVWGSAVDGPISMPYTQTVGQGTWTQEEVELEQEALASYETMEEEDREANCTETIEQQVLASIEREKKEGKR